MSLVVAGCATVPRPTAMDVERARLKDARATLEALEAGRHAYVLRCSGCHALYPPKSHTAGEWERDIPEMAARAKLSQAEVALITRYLTTLSERTD